MYLAGKQWKSYFIFITIFMMLPCLPSPVFSQLARKQVRLTNGWEFLRGKLGGIWEVWRDEQHQIIPWKPVSLPHCFNALDAVDPDGRYYQGEGWYRNTLKIENPFPNGRTLLHFEGAGQKTKVFVHTRQVGSHVGGYDEFTIDLTGALHAFSADSLFLKKFKGQFPIAIGCDNSRDLEMIPSNLSDFNLYGGLYRHVNLIYVPALSIDRLVITPKIDVHGTESGVDLAVAINNPLSISLPLEFFVEIDQPDGRRVIAKTVNILQPHELVSLGYFKVPNPSLWSPSHPNRYTCRVLVTSSHGSMQVQEKFGFRSFEFKEKGAFYLNGKRLLLRGTHRHEDHAGVAAAMTEEMMREEMRLIKEMGANFIRLGHYQQSRTILNLCDSLGLLVWEEIPWCRGGLGGSEYQAQARRMLTNMIQQHRNHPSVILWGLGNENDWEGDFATFSTDSIRNFMAELHQLSHALDSTRLTALRRCSFCADIIDVYSPSIWAGWYRGLFTQYKSVSWKEMNKTKRFFHAEWGGDSHLGRYGEDPLGSLAGITEGNGADERAGDYQHVGGAPRVSKDGDWSESYFCDLADWHLKEQETMDWLTGSAQWVFKDFSTPLRPENPIPYMNQKGVVQRDLTKKEGYYVFQSYWSEHPMVHIFGQRWDVRAGLPGEKKWIKVYSNCPEVELFVNGRSLGVKKRNSQDYPAAGLRWLVQLDPGAVQVKARAKSGKVTVMDSLQFFYQTTPWSTPQALSLRQVEAKGDTITVEALLQDGDGNRCLDGNQIVRFGLTGEGKLLDNLGTSKGSRVIQLANARASIRLDTRRGTSVVSVTSPGIQPAFLEIKK